jgi:hypothetical protein
MYTFAFCKTPLAPLTLPPGIAAFVQTVETEQLTALVEPAIALDTLQQDDRLLVQAVLAHDRVIRSLFLQTTILPLRFGTSFSSLEGLLAHLHTQQQRYLDQLTQLEGKAEYALKLTPVELPESTITSDVKGKAYFLAKKQQYQAQLLYQHQQQSAFEQIEQAIVQTYPHYCFDEDQAGGKTFYLLIARDREHQLCQSVKRLQAQSSKWQVALEEALPPYHFVGDSVKDN